MNDFEPWWLTRRAELLGLAAEASPAYVYDLASLDRAAAELVALGVFDRLLYAVKANPHPEILRRFAALGLGFECVSPGEIERVLQSCPEVSPDRVLFTPNFAPRREYEQALTTGVHLTLDSLHPLRHWQESLAGSEVFVRLDLGRGLGHHSHVRTAGSFSKFGIPREEWEELAALAVRANVRIVGLHSHAGSGILEPDLWCQTARDLMAAVPLFPEARVLDLGGGLGLPAPGQAPLDLRPLATTLERLRRDFAEGGRKFDLWLEPGRYLVADAGVLLATVTQVKGKGQSRYVGVDAGMNSLIRPMLYGAYQEIVNLSHFGEPLTTRADIVGPICESGDVLGVDRHLPETREGDVLLIATTGAYGHSMSSHYNLREPAREVVI